MTCLSFSSKTSHLSPRLDVATTERSADVPLAGKCRMYGVHWSRRPISAGGVNPVQTRHGDVGNDHVGRELCRGAHERAAVLHQRDDVEVWLKQPSPSHPAAELSKNAHDALNALPDQRRSTRSPPTTSANPIEAASRGWSATVGCWSNPIG
jgi:hypothetical protein